MGNDTDPTLGESQEPTPNDTPSPAESEDTPGLVNRWMSGEDIETILQEQTQEDPQSPAPDAEGEDGSEEPSDAEAETEDDAPTAEEPEKPEPSADDKAFAAIRQRERQLVREQKALKQQQEELAPILSAKEAYADNPLAALAALSGKSPDEAYNDVLNFVLEGGEVAKAPEKDPRLDEIEAWKKQQEEAVQQQAYNEVVQAYTQQVVTELDATDIAPVTHATKNHQLVTQKALEYAEDGQDAPPISQLAREVEQELAARASTLVTTLATIPAYADLMRQALGEKGTPAPEQTPEAPPPAQPDTKPANRPPAPSRPAKTLSNKQAAEQGAPPDPNRRRTDEERIAAAMRIPNE